MAIGRWSLLALAALLALGAGCNRNKEDPYRDWKAPQLLEEGDRLLRANDLAGADRVYRRGYATAEKAGYPIDKMRVFQTRELGIALAREDFVEARRLFGAIGGDSDLAAMDLRAATQLVVMLQRAGKMDEARAMGEKLAQRLAARPAQPEDLPWYVVGWIAIDRLRTANVELARAKEASTAVVDTLVRIAEMSQPIAPGLRGWITRYVDHLFDSDRTLVAQQIGDLVGRIDQLAPHAGDAPPCIALDDTFTALGCLADWK